jgi:hypothetical protein
LADGRECCEAEVGDYGKSHVRSDSHFADTSIAGHFRVLFHQKRPSGAHPRPPKIELMAKEGYVNPRAEKRKRERNVVLIVYALSFALFAVILWFVAYVQQAGAD